MQFYALFIVGVIVALGIFKYEVLSNSGTPGLVAIAFVLLSLALGYVSRNIWKRPAAGAVLEPEEKSVPVEDR